MADPGHVHVHVLSLPHDLTSDDDLFGRRKGQNRYFKCPLTGDNQLDIPWRPRSLKYGDLTYYRILFTCVRQGLLHFPDGRWFLDQRPYESPSVSSVLHMCNICLRVISYISTFVSSHFCHGYAFGR